MSLLLDGAEKVPALDWEETLTVGTREGTVCCTHLLSIYLQTSSPLPGVLESKCGWKTDKPKILQNLSVLERASQE